jgi:hypothetical protein
MSSLARWSVSLVAMVGVIAATVAGATVWLLMTDPVGGAEVIATAMTTRDVGPFIRAIGSVIYEALRGLFGYL